jgi:hypothetical protein
MTRVAVTCLYIASLIALLSTVHVYAAAEARSSAGVTLIGTVSCSRCQGYPPVHKGYTRWTWALHSVSEGDDIVFVVGSNIYKVQGDRSQLLKYMEDKVEVTGNLDGRILSVLTIARLVNKR